MIGFVARRLLVAVPVVLAATALVFALVSAQGDPLRDYRGRAGASEQTIRNLEEQYHLDQSKPRQYMSWLGDFVTGDWGRSFSSDRPVRTMVAEATGNSVLLVGTAVVLSAVVAMAVGVWSALRQGSWVDHTTLGASYLGYAMPDFWLALLLQLVLVVALRDHLDLTLFFVQGKHSVGETGLIDLLQHMALPVLTLMVTSVAAWSRYARAGVIQVLSSDFVRTARAKGVPPGRIVRRHVLRNGTVPFATIVAVDAGVLLGGVIVVERVFNWPGLGLLFVQALGRSDYPVLLAWMAVATTFVVVCNLLGDVVAGLLDPRLRLR